MESCADSLYSAVEMEIEAIKTAWNGEGGQYSISGDDAKWKDMIAEAWKEKRVEIAKGRERKQMIYLRVVLRQLRILNHKTNE